MKKTNSWLILLAAILTNLALGSGYAWSVYQQALLAENPSWVNSNFPCIFNFLLQWCHLA